MRLLIKKNEALCHVVSLFFSVSFLSLKFMLLVLHYHKFTDRVGYSTTATTCILLRGPTVPFQEVISPCHLLGELSIATLRKWGITIQAGDVDHVVYTCSYRMFFFFRGPVTPKG